MGIVFDGRPGFGENEYLVWIAAHPGGLVANVPKPKGPSRNELIRIHRTDDKTISSPTNGPFVEGESYFKACAEGEDKAGLIQWIVDFTTQNSQLGQVLYCKNCFSGGANSPSSIQSSISS